MSQTQENEAVPGSEDLMKRYEDMADAEEKAQDAQLPPGAREREEAAISKANAVFDAARNLLSDGLAVAVGYRVLVKPLEGTLGLEEAEKEVAPVLAEKGFITKTQRELEREEKGENHGVVIDVGPVAFKRHGGVEAWDIHVGDVVIYRRYCGTLVEHPPGSGVFYRFMNDEDIFGKVQ